MASHACTNVVLVHFLLLTATSCHNPPQKGSVQPELDEPTLSTRLENEIQPGMSLEIAHSVLARYGLEQATTSSENDVQFYREARGPWPTSFRVGVQIVKSEVGTVADAKVTCEGRGP